MRSLIRRFSAVIASLFCLGLTACQSTEQVKKKRPLLPGEEMSDLSWSRPTGPNDVATPMGLPMSR